MMGAEQVGSELYQMSRAVGTFTVGRRWKHRQRTLYPIPTHGGHFCLLPPRRCPIYGVRTHPLWRSGGKGMKRGAVGGVLQHGKNSIISLIVKECTIGGKSGQQLTKFARKTLNAAKITELHRAD